MQQTPEAVSALENIEELINSVRAYTDEQKRIAAESGDDAQARVTLDEWLQNVALLTDMDNEKPEERNKVTMMTVHGAKGLEFEYVYVAGLEENLFPSMMSLGNEEGLEEERRLFYVALTRAKRGAVLSFAESRFKWGEMTFAGPAVFSARSTRSFSTSSSTPTTCRRRKEGTTLRCGRHTAAGAVTGNRKPGARIIRGTPGRIIPAGSSPAGNVRPNVLRREGFRHAAAPVREMSPVVPDSRFRSVGSRPQVEPGSGFVRSPSGGKCRRGRRVRGRNVGAARQIRNRTRDAGRGVVGRRENYGRVRRSGTETLLRRFAKLTPLRRGDGSRPACAGRRTVWNG